MMRLLFAFLLTIILSCKTSDSFGLNKMNNSERNIFISSNLKTQKGVNLGNFIFHLQESKVDLTPFNQLLIDKLKASQYPYDINILTNLLVNKKENKSEIEYILNSKIKIWDTENWSEKFWTLIQEYNLNIEKPSYYSIENNSSKKYDVSTFLKTKIETDELGKKPMLMINWNITSYEEGKLIETLDKLDIKQIDYTSKNQAVSLYGKSGIDGLLKVTTY
ncbi:hypothetical protein QWZ06_03180 [Chryseobacterium tructae]|uniref:Lipoprotein n=1 Tax=Chryseobacterium tructae TaxID=1037380 RepID=A0ABV7XRM7_9FLAO|nr:hypothetical protein [Chryseobacterium tructae]MDN3691333.1 hypothetical protein [Chryseobacterium tructae]